MTGRPIYIGAGACGCTRIDVPLYQVDYDAHGPRLLCDACLIATGYAVPTPGARAATPTWSPPVPTVPPPPAYALGHGHTFDAVFNSQGALLGWWHLHPDARDLAAPACLVFCAVRCKGDEVHYEVINAEPLTLTPSLLCRRCGDHGRVTNGRWEPC